MFRLVRQFCFYFVLNGHVNLTTEEGLRAETFCEFIYLILMLLS